MIVEIEEFKLLFLLYGLGFYFGVMNVISSGYIKILNKRLEEFDFSI